jgi:hypothetical protein
MNTRPGVTTWQRQRLVDDAENAYVHWRMGCIAVWEAYERWTAATAPDSALAFSAYTAALEREERACEVYGERIRRAADLLCRCDCGDDGSSSVRRSGGRISRNCRCR